MNSQLLLDRLQETFGLAPSQWTRILEEPPLPLLRLPMNLINDFSSQYGYFPHIKCLFDRQQNPRLVVQISCFDLEQGLGGWAIPMAYQPQNEMQALRQELGFDEGWELAWPRTILVCGPDWLEFWEQVQRMGQLGLTVEGAHSAYPMPLQESDWLAIAEYLQSTRKSA